MFTRPRHSEGIAPRSEKHLRTELVVARIASEPARRRYPLAPTQSQRESGRHTPERTEPAFEFADIVQEGRRNHGAIGSRADKVGRRTSNDDRVSSIRGAQAAPEFAFGGQ